MAGISSKSAGPVFNKKKFNAKEEQQHEFSDESGLEWLDYGARMLDNQTGRFFVQDRYAALNLKFSPYQYGGNNPIFYIDVNGDFLNVGDFRKNNATACAEFIVDLEAKTGLKLDIDDAGNVTYTKNQGKAIVAKDKDGKNAGSKTARKTITNLLDSKTTVNVTNDESGRTETVKDANGKLTNTINFNVADITHEMDGTSNDMNKTTFGYALTFFHEIAHTPWGGEIPDPSSDFDKETAGKVERLANKIRKELGSEYGQRMTYMPLVIPNENKTYLPFSRKSMDLVNQGIVPVEKYIIMQVFNKK